MKCFTVTVLFSLTATHVAGIKIISILPTKKLKPNEVN